MTPDQKRGAWMGFAAAVLASHEYERVEYAANEADKALTLMEQRERERRFGLAEDVGRDAQDRNGCQYEAQRQRERADRAEAEVERLKAAAAEDFAAAGEREAEIGKVKSLLKEAFGVLRDLRPDFGPTGDYSDAENRKGIVLARARQEGFSDGE